jgi:putative FmdB family regulatory protein
MPLYEFTCQACEHAFEELVLNGEAVVCPECESVRVERQLSMPGKPRAGNNPLPMRCNTDLPPCGPGCCRL